MINIPVKMQHRRLKVEFWATQTPCRVLQKMNKNGYISFQLVS